MTSHSLERTLLAELPGPGDVRIDWLVMLRPKKIYVYFRFQAEKKLGMVGQNNILFCQNILFSR